MNKPSVVVSGASIAGLSAAYWLAHAGWDVTVIERASEFRTGGQNIDIRGIAREVLKRMDLFAAVKAHNTTEKGAVIVDARGDTIKTLPAGGSDGSDGATAELEILRGDLAQILLDALPQSVKMVYGETIEHAQEQSDRVVVTTKSQQQYEATLLVVAEGVRSTTRNKLFPDADVRELGITIAFGTIPRTKDDTDYWRWYNTTGGRQVHLRPDNRGTIRAVLVYENGKPLASADRPEAMAYLGEKFADAGWQSERVLRGFEHSDDVYIDDLAQVHLPKWHKGRVVLLGDAAWCVTPIGGLGASLALTGGYVLAAYTAQRLDAMAGASLAGVASALENYEAWMRQLLKISAENSDTADGHKTLDLPENTFVVSAHSGSPRDGGPQFS